MFTTLEKGRCSTAAPCEEFAGKKDEAESAVQGTPFLRRGLDQWRFLCPLTPRRDGIHFLVSECLTPVTLSFGIREEMKLLDIPNTSQKPC